MTNGVQARANELLKADLRGVKRIPFERALKADSTQHFDFIAPYVNDLENVVDMAAIAEAGLTAWRRPDGRGGYRLLGPPSPSVTDLT